jgi:hypothetical protein
MKTQTLANSADFPNLKIKKRTVMDLRENRNGTRDESQKHRTKFFSQKIGTT